jgi:hypothetical protein
VKNALIVEGRRRGSRDCEGRRIRFFQQVLESVADINITVVYTTEEAKRRIGTEPRIDIVVLISRSQAMVNAAKKIAQEHPRMRVVALTKFIPEGEVVWSARGSILMRPSSTN